MPARRPVTMLTAFVIAAVAAVAPAAAPPASAANGALITVTTFADTRTPNDGQCSLAEAITAANLDGADANADCVDGVGVGPDTIMFSGSGTITLGSPLPAFTTDVAVDGLLTVTVDGANAYQVFRTISGTSRLVRMTVQHGKSGTGGGIANEATMFLVGMTIRSNTANYGGGIWSSGTLTLDQSVVYGNSASISGAGLYSTGSTTVYNSTLTGNASPSGAGIQTANGITVIGGTIARNTANTSSGGGIRATSGPALIKGTIVAGNTGNQIVGTVTRTNSIVQTSADGLLDTALRDNGGPTRTIRLPAGSPALGIGVADTCDQMDLVDQRSFDRPATGCDIGAVQRDRVAPVKVFNPLIALRSGASLSGTSLRARIFDWGFDDGAGMGLDHMVLQRQVDGGSWRTIDSNITPKYVAAAVGGGMYNVTLAKGHSYRFRIRAYDQDGNASVWAYTRTVSTKLYQETSSVFRFSSGWTNASSTKYSGGAVKYTRTVGKSLRFTFTGRSAAFVTTVRPGASVTVDVYLDGVYKGESSFTYGGTTALLRRQVWTWDFASSSTHTVRMVFKGVSRFDADALAVLR